MPQTARRPRISPVLLQELYRHKPWYNLKIPLFYALLAAAAWLAWITPSPWVRWVMYAAMAYLWMGIVTFMHDASHGVLFRRRWKNWSFGVFSTIPILLTYVAFRQDHLAHHRYNRSIRDPDAFTMGKRRLTDFVLFYGYVLIGGVLTVVQFTLIYPWQTFGRGNWLIHAAELLLRVIVIGSLIGWAAQRGVLDQFLALWLIPIYLFSLLNSMRFIGEHYATPWGQGQMLGTRTIISNRITAFFWNNINYHIGHHLYPATPWYNLQRLHAALLPEIERSGAVVDASYLQVYADACYHGPETEERNALRLATRDRSTTKAVMFNESRHRRSPGLFL